MSRISIPATIEAAPPASQPLLAAVKKQLGVTPNLFRLDGCDYCLSAHTYLAKTVAKLDDTEIAANRAANRNGSSTDPKADAAVRFAATVSQERGHVREDDLQAVRSAGYDDAQIIEIVLHVALNTWTNYVNEVAKTDIDFPKIDSSKAA
jgi:AhpD family alkylhydroperoxidase